jgi:VCBS repeat-containing protein
MLVPEDGQDTLFVHCSDPESDPIEPFVTQNPTLGTLTVDADGSFRYDLDWEDVYGLEMYDDYFYYQVRDSHGGTSDEIIVRIAGFQDTEFLAFKNGAGPGAEDASDVLAELEMQGHRYWIVIFVDQPVPNDEDVYTWSGLNPVVGHTFVAIMDTETDEIIARVSILGCDYCTVLENDTDVAGEFKNDSTTGFDVRAYRISSTQYDSLEAVASSCRSFSD